MTDDDNEVQDLTSEELSREDKIEKLEQLCNQIGLDIEEVAGGTLEDLDVSGVVTFHNEDEDGNVKFHEEIEFE